MRAMSVLEVGGWFKYAFARHVRQWMCFPRPNNERTDRLSTPRRFRLLVQSCSGYIAFVSITQKSVPDERVALLIARILDERGLEGMNSGYLAWRFYELAGTEIEVLDDIIDCDESWDLQGAVPFAIRDAFSTLSAHTHLNSAMSISRDEIAQELTSRLHQQRDAFIRTLNPESVAVSRELNGLRGSSYNYFTNSNPRISRNRRQALALFPLLFQYCLNQNGIAELREAIDDGTPLIDVLATYYEVSKSAIRSIRNVHSSEVGPWGPKLGNLLLLLDDIPPERRPKTAEQWRRFCECTTQIARFSGKPIMTSTNRLWLINCATRSYQIPVLSPESMARISFEVEEFKTSVIRALCWELRGSQPNTQTEIELAATKLMGKMLSSIDIEKLGEIARRWGDAYRRAQIAFAQEIALQETKSRAFEKEFLKAPHWPVPITEAIQLGTIVVTPLQTKQALAIEAKKMGNCVAGYTDLCRQGHSQIWSLTQEVSARSTTLETRINRNKNGAPCIEIVQHRGPSNSEPPEAFKCAAKEILQMLRSQPAKLEQYLRWKESIPPRKIHERREFDVIQTTITSLKETLPKQWSYERLVEVSIKFLSGL